MCAIEKMKKDFTNQREVFILRKDKTTQRQFEKNPKYETEYNVYQYMNRSILYGYKYERKV